MTTDVVAGIGAATTSLQEGILEALGCELSPGGQSAGAFPWQQEGLPSRQLQLPQWPGRQYGLTRPLAQWQANEGTTRNAAATSASSLPPNRRTLLPRCKLRRPNTNHPSIRPCSVALRMRGCNPTAQGRWAGGDDRRCSGPEGAVFETDTRGRAGLGLADRPARSGGAGMKWTARPKGKAGAVSYGVFG